jgi:hypothetical protein
MLLGAVLLTATSFPPALVSGTAVAQLPPFYPATFQAAGTVDEVNLKENYIIVDDRQYTFAQGVQIRSPAGTIAKEALRKGMALGLNYRTAPNYEKFVTEIWVLPASPGASR